MSSHDVSVIGALTTLRGQVEDRLMQTEDYRALKALDRAIADVRAPAPARISNVSASLHIQPAPSPLNAVADQQERLSHQFGERFNGTAA